MLTVIKLIANYIMIYVISATIGRTFWTYKLISHETGWFSDLLFVVGGVCISFQVWKKIRFELWENKVEVKEGKMT